MDKKSLIHWTRVALGSLSGFLCGFFKFHLENAGKGILLACIIYIISFYIILYVYKIKPDNINIRIRDIFTVGAGSFIILWLYIWILILNLLYTP